MKSFPSFPGGSFSMFSLIFLSHWTVICMTVLLLFVDLKVLCNDCKSNGENFAIKLSVGTFDHNEERSEPWSFGKETDLSDRIFLPGK